MKGSQSDADPSELRDSPVNQSGVAPSKSEHEEPSDREIDWALVQRAQRGDAAAFEQLFHRHHRRAFAVAVGVVKNKQDAMDIVQDAFVKVHRHIGSFQGSSSFYTWLYRIVMNLAIDQTRRSKVQKNVDYDDSIGRDSNPGDGPTTHALVADSNPRRTTIRRELSENIQRALQTLPEHHRAVIVLREVEGFSYEEMAKMLRVPKGTIMSRLFHARKKMQEELGAYLDGDLEVGD